MTSLWGSMLAVGSLQKGRNSLGPLESEASRSGKANILGFCLSSCVQAKAQALARKSG